MSELDKALEKMTDATRDSELMLADHMTDSSMQKAILKNLIEIKYLLMQINRNANRK